MAIEAGALGNLVEKYQDGRKYWLLLVSLFSKVLQNRDNFDLSWAGWKQKRDNTETPSACGQDCWGWVNRASHRIAKPRISAPSKISIKVKEMGNQQGDKTGTAERPEKWRKPDSLVPSQISPSLNCLSNPSLYMRPASGLQPGHRYRLFCLTYYFTVAFKPGAKGKVPRLMAKRENGKGRAQFCEHTVLKSIQCWESWLAMKPQAWTKEEGMFPQSQRRP